MKTIWLDLQGPGVSVSVSGGLETSVIEHTTVLVLPARHRTTPLQFQSMIPGVCSASHEILIDPLMLSAGVTALDDRSGPPDRHRLEQRFNSKVGPITHWEGLMFHCLMD